MNSDFDTMAGFEACEKELDELKDMLREAAVPDCRGCDGSGVFMGSVCICACVSAVNIERNRAKKEEVNPNVL